VSNTPLAYCLEVPRGYVPYRKNRRSKDSYMYGLYGCILGTRALCNVAPLKELAAMDHVAPDQPLLD
jgi:hypothetical protein